MTEEKPPRGYWRILVAAASISALLLGAWIVQKADRRPPKQAAISAPNASGIAWCVERPDATCLPHVCQGHALTLVYFGAEWCGPCKRFRGVTLKDPRVIAKLKGRAVVMIDVDLNPETAEASDIQSLPTAFFLDQSCEPVGNAMIGGAPPDAFLKMLEAAEEAAQRKTPRQ
jgi:thiol:disulfide interchange protein